MDCDSSQVQNACLNSNLPNGAHCFCDDGSYFWKKSEGVESGEKQTEVGESLKALGDGQGVEERTNPDSATDESMLAKKDDARDKWNAPHIKQCPS